MLYHELVPLQNDGLIHVATFWRWLRENSWPTGISDNERLELARDVVRIGGAGTIDHLALFLRDTLPTMHAEPCSEVAAQLMVLLAQSLAEHGAGSAIGWIGDKSNRVHR